MLFPTIEDFATDRVVSLPHDAPVHAALAEMIARNVRDVVINGPGPADLGIVTIVDVIRARIQSPELDQPVTQAGYRRLVCVRSNTGIMELLEHVSATDEYIGVLDGDGQLCGIASYSDVLSGVDPRSLIERQRVGELLARHQIATVAPDCRLNDAVALFEGVSDAVLVSEHGRALGVLTTKDAVRLFAAGVPLERPVREYMSSPVETVSPDISVKDAIDFLHARRFKRLIIADAEGRVLGAIKQRDLLLTAYNRWSELMRVRTQQLYEMVDGLQRRNAELSEIVATDALTGLDNRRMFERTLAGEIERCCRFRNHGFAILLLDVDHFKVVNDTYGHPRGDEVLQHLARTLEGGSRGSDLLARWGGEEFVVLLPNAGVREARELGERLRQRVAEADMPVPVHLTISIGVAAYQEGDTPLSLMARADEALYAAKRAGRNRVEIG